MEAYLLNLTINLITVDYVEHTKNSFWYNYTVDFSSIGLICDGDAWIRVDGVDIYPKKNDLYLLPSKTMQSFDCVDRIPHKKYYCHFNALVGDTSIFEIIKTPFCIDTANFVRAKQIFIELCDLQLEKDALSIIKSKASLLELIYLYLKGSPNIEYKVSKDGNKQNIENILTYIEENLDQDLSVGLLAKLINFHPNYFTRMFKTKTGFLPKHYIIHRRMTKASNLLMRTNESIAEIAQKTGFKNQFYFTNAFKKINGLTPSDYRNFTK